MKVLDICICGQGIIYNTEFPTIGWVHVFPQNVCNEAIPLRMPNAEA